jgi:hypothetical protein
MSYKTFLYLAFTCGLATLGRDPHAGEADSIRTLIVSGPVEHCTGSVVPCYAIADCPTGMHAIGGGMAGYESKIQGSYPAGGSWITKFRGAYYEYSSSAKSLAQAFAICSFQHVATSGYGKPQLKCSSGGNSCDTYLLCQKDELVVVGGFSGQQMLLETSTPYSAGWAISWVKDSEELGSTAIGTIIPGASCTNRTELSVEYVFGETIACQETSCSTTVSCPSGKVLVAGGFAGLQSHVQSMYPSSNSSWSVSWYPARSAFGSTAAGLGSAQAVCVNGAPFVDQVFMSGFDATP